MPRMSEMMKKSPNPYVKSRKKREEEIADAIPAESAASGDAEKPNQSNNVSRETFKNLSIDKSKNEPKSESATEQQKSTRSVGRPPAGRTAQLTLMMDPNLKKSLKKYCVDEGKSVAAVIEDLVREMLEKEN